MELFTSQVFRMTRVFLKTWAQYFWEIVKLYAKEKQESAKTVVGRQLEAIISYGKTSYIEGVAEALVACGLNLKSHIQGHHQFLRIIKNTIDSNP